MGVCMILYYKYYYKLCDKLVEPQYHLVISSSTLYQTAKQCSLTTLWHLVLQLLSKHSISLCRNSNLAKGPPGLEISITCDWLTLAKRWRATTLTRNNILHTTMQNCRRAGTERTCWFPWWRLSRHFLPLSLVRSAAVSPDTYNRSPSLLPGM